MRACAIGVYGMKLLESLDSGSRSCGGHTGSSRWHQQDLSKLWFPTRPAPTANRGSTTSGSVPPRAVRSCLPQVPGCNITTLIDHSLQPNTESTYPPCSAKTKTSKLRPQWPRQARSKRMFHLHPRMHYLYTTSTRNRRLPGHTKPTWSDATF